jgi:hypothetical protein
MTTYNTAVFCYLACDVSLFYVFRCYVSRTRTFPADSTRMSALTEAYLTRLLKIHKIVKSSYRHSVSCAVQAEDRIAQLAS